MLPPPQQVLYIICNRMGAPPSVLMEDTHLCGRYMHTHLCGRYMHRHSVEHGACDTVIGTQKCNGRGRGQGLARVGGQGQCVLCLHRSCSIFSDPVFALLPCVWSPAAGMPGHRYDCQCPIAGLCMASFVGARSRLSCRYALPRYTGSTPVCLSVCAQPHRSTSVARPPHHPAPPSPMAAVAGEMVMPVKPVVGPSIIMPLAGLSVDPSSGWRKAQDSVIRHFVTSFQESFGQSILGGVKVLSADRAFKEYRLDPSGKVLIDDGLSTVMALLRLESLVVSGTLLPENLCEPLQAALKNGIPVTPIYYQNDDQLSRLTWQTAAHGEENNRFLSSTLSDLMRVIQGISVTRPEETRWPDTTRYLLSVYGWPYLPKPQVTHTCLYPWVVLVLSCLSRMCGPVPARQSKRRNVARWVSAAKALAAPVLAWLDTRVSDKGPACLLCSPTHGVLLCPCVVSCPCFAARTGDNARAQQHTMCRGT